MLPHAYLRNITLRPSLLKDCIFFLITILIINSLLFLALNFIFNYELDYFDQIINITYTLFYYIFYFQIYLIFLKIYLCKVVKMLGEDFGVKKIQTINRRMFIIGAAKFIVFTGIIVSTIFIANYRE